MARFIPDRIGFIVTNQDVEHHDTDAEGCRVTYITGIYYDPDLTKAHDDLAAFYDHPTDRVRKNVEFSLRLVKMLPGETTIKALTPDRIMVSVDQSELAAALASEGVDADGMPAGKFVWASFDGQLKLVFVGGSTHRQLVHQDTK